MEFKDLNLSKQLVKAVDALGFVTPTTIQEKAFPVIMSGKDMVGIAQTGTGKTFAFLLPILNQLKFSKIIEPRVLVLVPTRELVVQITDELEKLTEFINIRSLGVYGGANINTQKSALLSEGTDILVATPGRMIDLALSGSLRLKYIQKIVIDEMDEMLNLGFRTQLKTILELLPEKRQNLLFSATITDDVRIIIEEYFNGPTIVEAAPHGTPLENIRQTAYFIPNFNSKVNLLKLLLKSNPDFSKVLIFTSSKSYADLLAQEMEEDFMDHYGVIHSNKSQNNRFATMKRFQEGTCKYLIATDLVSRGLDISDVSHVINFDMPEDSTIYIHRIGRTGRADKEGISISFITEAEQKLQSEVETLMGIKIEINDSPEDLVISDVLIEQEKPVIPGINYSPEATIKESQGAFHKKKTKNTKVNLGGSYKIEIKKKYKKPKTRGQKRK
jgi:ATP-dependent RNA helicase RhlE